MRAKNSVPDAIRAVRPGVQFGQMDYDGFYAEQGPRLLRLCYLATLDREAAADAAQETLTRAWKHWQTLADGNPVAWSRTVALNLCRSRWRRLARETRLLPRVYRIPDAEPTLPDVDVRQALEHLSPRQREAVALFYWLDLSVADCAAAMETSEGSVKSYLARARDRLARELGAEVELV